MMERERVQKGTRERVGSAARSRTGEFAFSSSCLYSAKADFDNINVSRIRGDPAFVATSIFDSGASRNWIYA